MRYRKTVIDRKFYSAVLTYIIRYTHIVDLLGEHEQYFHCTKEELCAQEVGFCVFCLAKK